MPKRLPSAFLLSYSMYCPKEIKGGPPDLFIGDITRKLGAMWNNPADVRQPGEKKTAKLKGKCEKDIAAYGAKGKPNAEGRGLDKAENSKKKKEDEDEGAEDEEEAEGRHEDGDDMLVLARFLSLSVKDTPHTKSLLLKKKH